MKLEASDQIEKFKEFIEVEYQKQLHELVTKGTKAFVMDFAKLSEFDIELAEDLLAEPEEVVRAAELAMEQFDLPEGHELKRVRFKNLPKSQFVKIGNIRSVDLGKFIWLEGIVRQASDVRPQVTSAKFECSGCGNTLSILQIDVKFKEPSRCTCGWRGRFKLISQELIDVQHLKIEESPESLEGGEQPKRIGVILKEDLVDSTMVKKTAPGSRINVFGIVKEVPIQLKTGAQSIRYDLIVEANYTESVQEEFSDIFLSKEDEEEITEFAKDPALLEKFVKAIAPSIYGYEEIKKALVLQLLGGVRKVKPDGTANRGDIHILCVGDPGSGKSQLLQFMSKAAPKARFVSGKGASLDYKEPLIIKQQGQIKILSIGQFVDNYSCWKSETFVKLKERIDALSLNLHTKKLEWKQISSVYRHKSEDKLLKFTLESGRQITVTKDHSIFILQDGQTITKSAEELTKEDYVLIPSKVQPPKIVNDLEPKLAKLIGYYIAEGYIRNSCGSYKIVFTLNKSEKNIAQEINELSKSYLSKEARCYNQGSGGLRVVIYGKQPYLKFSSFLEGCAHLKAKEKRIPHIIFNASLESQKEFIKAYLIGDAGVTKSKYLMSDLLYLYLQQEIIASCNVRVENGANFIGDRKIIHEGERFDLKSPCQSKVYKNRYKNAPCSRLGGLLKKYFLQNILSSDYKRANIYRVSNKTLFNRLDYVNNSIIAMGSDLKSNFGESTLEYFGENASLFTKLKQGRNCFVALSEQGSVLMNQVNNLRALAKSDLGFVKIKKVEEVDSTSEYVYDISVPGYENFVAGFGGAICHNTGAGITAAVVKDEFLRGWSLEAGALVLANKGLCVVDELDKMSSDDRSALHEALEQQCMLPDFKLMLSNGTSVEIGKFVDNLMKKNEDKIYKGKDCEILPIKNVELLSTDFKTHFPIKADRVSRHLAPKEFVKIELTNGREITVTPEHPCWVVKDGKIVTAAARELTEKMYFPIPSQLKIKAKPYNLKNNYLCKILGYHLSDGCYELNRGKKVGIQFWNNDEILINDYKKSIEKFFNVKPGITRRKHQFAVRVISKKVFEYLKDLGGNLTEKGDTKKIPEEIMRLPNENLKYLLAAIYDGDGTVVFQKRNGCRISLVSQNRELMEQVSDILLRFGIQSSIFLDKSNYVWKLDTSGQENLSKFLSNITFLSKHKRERLKEYCAKDKTYRSIKDVIPNCADKIFEIFKKLKISMRKEIGHSIDLGVEKHRLFLQKLVLIAERELIKKEVYNKRIYSDLEDELVKIKKLAFGYARWMKIKSVSKVKNKEIKWVYDVTVEPNHTFISEGLILHNTITISKANIQATLRAETTLLAAANPKLGRFDPYTPIASQIDLPSTLINRFDLIFPIRDIPSKERDTRIATHVLESAQSPEIYDTEVDIKFMRRYVAYVKTKIFPKMSKAAVNEIRDFYVSLRNSGRETDEGVKPIPISARQLEALIRLSEASARLRLSELVSREDAKIAIDLLKHCLMQIGFDPETGQIDIDRISTGISASTRSKIVSIKEIINSFDGRGVKTIPVEDIINEAASKGIEEGKVFEIIDQLKRTGDIFEPRRGFVQKI